MGAGDEVPEGDGLRRRENLKGRKVEVIAGVWKAKMAGIAWGWLWSMGSRDGGKVALHWAWSFLIAGWCCSPERRDET